MARPYKILRCRYFDASGRPLKPYCSSGQNCGFLHPNEPGWAEGKFATEKFTPYDPRSRNPRPRTRSPSPPRRMEAGGRPPPPMDPFSRFKVERDVDDAPMRWDDVDRSRERVRGRDYDAPSTSLSSRWNDQSALRRPPSPLPSSYPPNGFSTPSDRTRDVRPPGSDPRPGPSRFGPPITPATAHNPPVHTHAVQNQPVQAQPVQPQPVQPQPGQPQPGQPHAVQTPAIQTPSTPQHPARNQPVQNQPELETQGTDKRRVEKIVELFRHLAQTTDQANRETSLTNAEYQKVKAFTHMSTELTSDTLSSVAPVMADVIANHKKLKAQTDVSFEKIGHIWQDIFGAVVEGMVEELQDVVETALGKLRRDGNTAVAGMVVDAMAKEHVKQRELDREREMEREREREALAREREREMEMSVVKRKPSIPDLRGPGALPYGMESTHDYDTHKRRRMDSPSMVMNDPLRTEGSTLPASPAQPSASDPVAMMRYMQEMLGKMQADKARVEAENARLNQQLESTQRAVGVRGSLPPSASASAVRATPVSNRMPEDGMRYSETEHSNSASRRQSLGYTYDAPPAGSRDMLPPPSGVGPGGSYTATPPTASPTGSGRHLHYHAPRHSVAEGSHPSMGGTDDFRMRRPPSRVDTEESISAAGSRPAPNTNSGLSYDSNPNDPRQGQY